VTDSRRDQQPMSCAFHSDCAHSDSRRNELAEALAGSIGGLARDYREAADALLPLVDRMCAAAAAEAVREVAADLVQQAGNAKPSYLSGVLAQTAEWVRRRAAALANLADHQSKDDENGFAEARDAARVSIAVQRAYQRGREDGIAIGRAEADHADHQPKDGT